VESCGSISELVCKLTEYEPDLERWGYKKKDYKSYYIQKGNSFELTRAYYAEDLRVDIKYISSSMVKG